MIRAYSTVVFLMFFSYFQTTTAQDIHYTNYSYAPLYLNPAQTGSFAGTYRISGIAREQFTTFVAKPFRTAMVAVDAPLDFAFRKTDWIGVGLSLYQDQGGDLSFKTRGALLSLSYHIALDKKQKTVLTLAGQQGFFQRSINEQYFPEDALISKGTTLDKSLFDGFSHNSTDFSGGAQLNTQVGKSSAFEIGAAMYHILVPGQDRNVIPRRLTTHASLYAKMSNKIYIEPALYYSRTSASNNNIVLQVKNHFRLGKTVRKGRKKVTTDTGAIMLGLGYRVKDALQILTGFEYKKWQFGLSYDLTLSTASPQTNYYGALEIGLKRIFITGTTPDIKPIIICPRL